MTETERKVLIATLRRYKRKFARDKNASKKFFIKAGILTSTGKLTAPYKRLCIPPEQA
jgi:hypothetical protein